jgi:hypothetical protein
MTKLMVALSDTHCGHVAGLTPPDYQLHESQKVYWDAFAGMLKQFRGRQRIDVAVWNADLIDGRGERSGSTELSYVKRDTQVEIATEIVKFVNAKNNIFTFGTPYHTGDKEDWESQIAKACHKNEDGTLPHISGQQFFQVNKTVFHAKHKVGSSSIPHGRFTALARQKVWSLFWAEHGESPKADVFLRSHTHYHAYCGDDTWLAVILPALQGWSSYGERQCEGTVHFGFVGFWVSEHKELPAWRAYVCRSAKKSNISKF